MPAFEMWDYLSTVSPDNTAVFTVDPQLLLVEEPQKAQVIHIGDDGSEEVITQGNAYFYATLQYAGLNTTDAGEIFDLHCNSTRANFRANSFWWQAPDGHNYVVKFAELLGREWQPGWIGSYREIKLKILGRATY